MGFENVSGMQVTVGKESKQELVKVCPEPRDDRDAFDDEQSTLDLSNCNLTNAVRLDFIGSHVTHLSLAHNNLDKVPSCFYSGLKNLQSLDLSYNQIEEFDMEPECIRSLKRLKLNNNLFTNIPKWFLMFRAVNLEEFDFSSNKSTHFNYLRNSYNLNVIKLKKLTLRSCCLIDDDYGFLRCFRKLENLDLSNENHSATKHMNKFEDIDELFVKSKWKHLEVLTMNYLSLSLFPEGITWLESLIELYFTHNCISWFPNGIEFMANLEVLDVSNNTLISLPDNLLKLEFLRVIKAPHNFIECTLDFTCMKYLEILDLYDNLIDEISINIDTIKYIDLELNYIDSNTFPTGYVDKKKYYRESKKISRLDGIKSLPDVSTSSGDEEDEACSHFGKNCYLNSSDIQEECWDTPIQVKEKNPDIDSEDENWEYEIPAPKPKIVEKIYVEDEDWMFEDVF